MAWRVRSPLAFRGLAINLTIVNLVFGVKADYLPLSNNVANAHQAAC
jgi:hypothetical protein